VSRHVRSLEQLGTQLMSAQHGIRLTPGATYLRVLRGALDQIDHAPASPESPDDNLLRLKLPPTFAIRWLVPRLARFHALHPAIDVQITTSHERADFDREDIDACIHSEPAPPQGPGFRRLVGEVLVPVCSPRLLQRRPPLQDPADLARHVLLCSLNRPHDWPAWLAAAGVAHLDGNSGLKFENAALAYQAAIDELGVMVAQLLVEDDLRSGPCHADPLPLRMPGGYSPFPPTGRRPHACSRSRRGWSARRPRRASNAHRRAAHRVHKGGAHEVPARVTRKNGVVAAWRGGGPRFRIRHPCADDAR
jgi:LysR family glycine cleavage system transcriptional activator